MTSEELASVCRPPEAGQVWLLQELHSFLPPYLLLTANAELCVNGADGEGGPSAGGDTADLL